MITNQDPLQGSLFYQGLSFSRYDLAPCGSRAGPIGVLLDLSYLLDYVTRVFHQDDNCNGRGWY